MTYLHVQQKTSRLPKRNTVLSLCERISSTISIHDGKNVWFKRYIRTKDKNWDSWIYESMDCEFNSKAPFRLPWTAISFIWNTWQTPIHGTPIKFWYPFSLNEWKITHEDIKSIRLYEESYILLAPKETFKNQSWVDVEDLPLILPNKNSQVRKHLDDYFNRRNIRPNVVVETDRFESAVGFVHLGIGYAIIPRFYYQSFNTSNLEYKKMRPNLGRKIYINYHKNANTPNKYIHSYNNAKII